MKIHAKTEVLDFNTEDVRLVITERSGKQEIRMHGDDARFIVEAVAAANRAALAAAAHQQQEPVAVVEHGALPPLPESKTYAIDPRGLDKQVFSADDMRDYDRAAIAAQPPQPAQDAVDAARYRRLRVLGAAPYGSTNLTNKTVLRFTNLDTFVDADMVAHPSRGESGAGD